MSATSALESNEDLDNVPLVRMEDIQPDRSCEGVNLQQIKREKSIDDGCLLNDDEGSNIGSMVSIKSEEVIDYQDDNNDNVEFILPDVTKDEHHIAVKLQEPKAPDTWPTLEILPGGVIKNTDKYEDDLSLTCPVMDGNKNEFRDMIYTCAKCSESFDDLILLVSHVRWHEEVRKKEDELNELKLQGAKKCVTQTCKRKPITELKTNRKVPKKS